MIDNITIFKLTSNQMNRSVVFQAQQGEDGRIIINGNKTGQTASKEFYEMCLSAWIDNPFATASGSESQNILSYGLTDEVFKTFVTNPKIA